MNFRKYFAEFIGTFFLALTCYLTIFNKVSSDLQPLAMSFTFMALIYSMGHISGAQFNPAVTIAFFLKGKITAKDSGFYIASQLLGSILASVLSLYLISSKPPVAPFAAPPQYFGIGQAVLGEMLGTFILTWVVLNMTMAKALENSGFYGIAIAAVFGGMLYSFSSISGGFFNPALAIGLCINHLGNWSLLWIYLIGAIGGGILAALSYRFVNS